MKKQFTLLVLVGLSYSNLTGQDIHFSQFYNSPLTLNPALTGDFEGSFRFTGNQRRQWASVANPFNTYGLGAEANEPFDLKSVKAGMSIYNDVAGTGNLGNLQLQGAFAYRLPLSRDSTAYLQAGIQAGYNRRQIDFQAFSFDNQFVNNRYVPAAPTGETFDNNAVNYFNAHFGISAGFQLFNSWSIKVGTAFHNLNRPNIAFNPNLEEQLDRRWTLHATARNRVVNSIEVLPRFLYMLQGPHQEVVLGSDVRYILDDRWFSTRAAYFGLYARWVDALILRFGLDYNTWHFGASYDINYSSLNRASNGRGGFELSVIYVLRELLPKRTRYKSCPDFI